MTINEPWKRYFPPDLEEQHRAVITGRDTKGAYSDTRLGLVPPSVIYCGERWRWPGVPCSLTCTGCVEARRKRAAISPPQREGVKS